ncbi:tudor domain-containing protein 5-like isoform X3 [Prorops nasuta]|uniref:tudor domain-containing protein 5-like isoform X3 n=1 Tax=Prorops nasuta TaxID=863751 RepID=UPI0034CDF3CB
MSTFHSKREEVEQLLLAFLVSRKGSTTIHDLDADYKAQEGKSIPFKELGYATLLEFLRSIPQTLTVQKINNVFYCKGKSNDQTRHISQLVEGQKPSGRSIRARRKVPPSRYFPQTLPAKISIPFSTFRYVIEIIKKNVNGVDIRDIIQIVKGKIPNIQLVYSDVVDQLREVPHEVYIDNGVVYPVKQNIQTNQSYFEVPSTNIMFSGEEPENYEADIAVESPYNVKSGNKMPASSFIQEAVHKSKKLESPVKEIENVSEPYSLKDIPEPDEGSPDNVAVNASMLISERTKIRLEKLIEQYPDGIWCKELPRKYEETYKISLNYAELGFNSMREYAMQLPEIFHCQQPVPFGDFKLYYAKKLDSQDISSQSDSKMNLAQLHDIYMEEDTLAVPPNLSKDTCQKLIPDNVMTYEESVGFINVTYLEPESFFEVSVVEVFHPSFFWIQLRKKQQKFKAFMEDLAKFYSVEHTRYAIPPIVLNPCLNCACQYNGIWHRGIIKSVSPDHRVTVMFYDYGTICTYDAASVYYLHRKFSSLPAQAVPCGLVNVKPISGNSWSRSVVYKFAERTSRNPLIAIISSRNEKNNSMLVTLTDTFGEEDVHINDWLVKEKLAEYGRMVRIWPKNFAFLHYVKCKNLQNTDDTSDKTCKTNKNFSEQHLMKQTSEHVNFVSCSPFIHSMAKVESETTSKSENLLEKILSLKEVKCLSKKSSLVRSEVSEILKADSVLSSHQSSKNLSVAAQNGICLHLLNYENNKTELPEDFFSSFGLNKRIDVIDWSALSASENNGVKQNVVKKEKEKNDSNPRLNWLPIDQNKVKIVNETFLHVVNSNPNYNSYNWSTAGEKENIDDINFEDLINFSIEEPLIRFDDEPVTKLDNKSPLRSVDELLIDFCMDSPIDINTKSTALDSEPLLKLDNDISLTNENKEKPLIEQNKFKPIDPFASLESNYDLISTEFSLLDKPLDANSNLFMENNCNILKPEKINQQVKFTSSLITENYDTNEHKVSKENICSVLNESLTSNKELKSEIINSDNISLLSDVSKINVISNSEISTHDLITVNKVYDEGLKGDTFSECEVKEMQGNLNNYNVISGRSENYNISSEKESKLSVDSKNWSGENENSLETGSDNVICNVDSINDVNFDGDLDKWDCVGFTDNLKALDDLLARAGVLCETGDINLQCQTSNINEK